MAEVSGPQWCARFPTSNKLEDLTQDFGDACRAFISAMKKGGATVSVAATYRPPERAYLMHWCCMIGNSGQDPASRRKHQCGRTDQPRDRIRHPEFSPKCLNCEDIEQNVHGVEHVPGHGGPKRQPALLSNQGGSEQSR